MKYFVKYGYFGDKGIKQIPKWKALFCRWFTDVAIFVEKDGVRYWWDNNNFITDK